MEGGANLIDKIRCEKLVYSDIHFELVELLKYAQENAEKIPNDISEEEYNNVKNNKHIYASWYVGLVGFCATFATKYFGGYARVRQTRRNMPNESIRNKKKQAPNLKNIEFYCRDYRYYNLENTKNAVIYVDPPYKDALSYKNEIDYEEFYEWCRNMSSKNIVLISEYNMPNDFECIWQKETSVNFDSNRNSKQKRVEKLFIYNKNKKED